MIGAGPAGWAAAAALRSRGRSVVLVAPDPEAVFANGYGVWVDELEGVELGGPIWSTVWSGVRVHVGSHDERRLERAYGRVDNHKLRTALTTAAEGTECHAGRVDRIDDDDDSDGFVVRLEGGRALRARAVIDASGHESPLIEQETGPAPGWQVALGRRIEVPHHPWPVEEAVLMDFRLPEDTPDARARASFLYVLPESENVVFVEETSLTGRPRLAIEVLESRLDARLAALGVPPGRVLETERCFIPMGGPPPPRPQPVVAFGGAARMVHPASGYLLARILRTAPRLAEALDRALVEGLSRAERSEAAWAAVWSGPERVSHELYRFGSELLLTMDAESTTHFFSTFFRLPAPLWSNYLSGTATPSEVRRAMRGVFARASWSLRFRLARAGLGPEGSTFRKSLFSRG